MKEIKNDKRDYESIIKQLWQIKEEIYQDLKKEGMENYSEYLKRNIAPYREKFLKQYNHPHL
jgi:hypothetical protein